MPARISEKERRRCIHHIHQEHEECTGLRQAVGYFCRELCEHLPGPHSSLLLGDAFMNIQEVSKGPHGLASAPLPPPSLTSPMEEKRETPTLSHQPEKALEVYDEAYRKNPHDASLISRIGQAYVKTHQYTKVRLGWVGEVGRASPAGKMEKGAWMGGRVWMEGEWLSFP